jgi:predicted nuclease of restriction endonuclease-like (RecB) superfamily
VVENLARRLADRFRKGFSVPNLRNMRQFFLVYPRGSALPEDLGGPAKRNSKIRSALPSVSRSPKIRSAAPSELAATTARLFPPSLGWTHYTLLMRVDSPAARAFYEIEAAREGWTSRELERQIASLLFERLAKSRDKDKVLALARRGHQLDGPGDVLKDPFVLEFLGLSEKSAWREHELEQAIIDRIEEFLLELGKGFCFVARQKRMTLEGDHFYVDLVFYNRLLRCFVLVDLKLGKLTHQDLGQMQMYVNFFDRFQRSEHEAKTIGIVLCSEKNDAMAKITLPDNNEQILAARYQMYLPTEEELRAELAREREEAERALRLAVREKEP